MEKGVSEQLTLAHPVTIQTTEHQYFQYVVNSQSPPANYPRSTEGAR